MRYPSDLDAALAGLRQLGLASGRGSAEDCALRKVKDMVWFADFSGNRIELVVRPLNSGWRYFPSRDAGVRGLADVIMRSVDVEKDLSIWSGILGAEVSDWAGNAAYLRFDDAHHRIVLFPPRRPGILSVEYAVEDVNLLMRNYYVLRDLQVALQGRDAVRPRAAFPTSAGPTDVLFSFVAEGAAGADGGRPGSFPPAPRDFAVGEANARSASSTKLRMVGAAKPRDRQEA